MHRSIVTAVLALGLMAEPALAQMQMEMAAPDLPAICLEAAGHAMPAPPTAMGQGDAAHQALMAGMDTMNADMMAGGTAADLDVAFICAMIPHHRGAISMAKAELEHGDDLWARGLAEAIIAAQEKEIAAMLDWLARQPR